MALPGPGPALSLDNIGVEFGDTRPHAINEFYRGGPLVGNFPANNGVPTANQIAIGNFYNANNRNAYTVSITTSTNNYNAYAARGPQYFAGKSDITYSISPGVVITSSSTAAAFTVPSEFNTGDTITIVNNGTILGRGGNGGAGGGSSPVTTSNGSSGGSGSTALQVSRPVTVQNNANIWGGGGGGGGGGGARSNSAFFPGDGTYTFSVFTNGATAGGGGGGGGRGISNGGFGGPANAPFSSFPGSNGTGGSAPTNGGGASGGSGPGAGGQATGGTGGAGGGAGATGTAGSTAPSGPAVRGTGGPAGSAGNYITGNNFVTWTANGSRLGGVGS